MFNSELTLSVLLQANRKIRDLLGVTGQDGMFPFAISADK
jgi:hypothetical protein